MEAPKYRCFQNTAVSKMPLFQNTAVPKYRCSKIPLFQNTAVSKIPLFPKYRCFQKFAWENSLGGSGNRVGKFAWSNFPTDVSKRNFVAETDYPLIAHSQIHNCISTFTEHFFYFISAVERRINVGSGLIRHLLITAPIHAGKTVVALGNSRRRFGRHGLGIVGTDWT